MPDYILSCCSTLDLTKEHLTEKNINFIPFHFFINETHYYDDLGQTLPSEKLYEAMRAGADVKTSQVNSDEFTAYFTPFLEQGKDILHVSMSSGISGVYNSAMIAKKELEEKFPERKIYVIDSLAASAGYGLLMDKLADLKNSGMSIDKLKDFAENNKLKVWHWFTSTDLTFYIKGGRVSKTAGFFGGLLKICPVLNVDKNGKLNAVTKVRTKQKSITELLNKMVECAENGENYSGKCFISQSDCYEDAKMLANLIEEKFKNLDGKVLINNIGPTIGSHTGPGTIALFFWGKER